MNEPAGPGDWTELDLATTLDVDASRVDPFGFWQEWLDDAVAAGMHEPTAALVATVDVDGAPDARFVLVREVDTDGFVFYTNLESAKGEQLRGHPVVTLVFGWLPLQRSVRVRGRAELVSAERADAYFATRPRGSQIGAWASPQSRVVDDRSVLESNVAELDARFEGAAVPRPPFWGGWKVVPTSFEFWQGRTNRLHDRVRWTARADAPTGWVQERLGP